MTVNDIEKNQRSATWLAHIHCWRDARECIYMYKYVCKRHARGKYEIEYAYICIHIHVIQIQVQRSANLTASCTRVMLFIIIHNICEDIQTVYRPCLMITCILHSPYYNHLFC